MFRNFAIAFLPLLKPARSVALRQPKTLYSFSNTKKFFSTEKPSEGDKPAANEDKKAAVKKLTELSNQELIEINTEESMKIVHNNIKKMEQTRAKQTVELKELNEKLEFIAKHHTECANKEAQLLENIKLQEEELIRIKKRADKQIDDSKDYAISKIAKELLEFADSLKRCMVWAKQHAQEKPEDLYYQGIIGLDAEFKKFLKDYDIEQFDPINTPFDPNTSEGMVTIPTPPGYTKGHVATTMFTGYKIKSRLLRSAKVGIFV